MRSSGTMPTMTNTPDPPEVITMPEDAYVYSAADNLTTADAPLANGAGDQTDGMGAL